MAREQRANKRQKTTDRRPASDRASRSVLTAVAMLDNELRRCAVTVAVRHGQSVGLSNDQSDAIGCRAY